MRNRPLDDEGLIVSGMYYSPAQMIVKIEISSLTFTLNFLEEHALHRASQAGRLGRNDLASIDGLLVRKSLFNRLPH